MGSPIRSTRGFENMDLRRVVAELQAVNFFAERVLKASSWRECIPEILEKLAIAADADRAYILERHIGEDGTPLLSFRYEYDAPGIEPMKHPRLQNLRYREEVPADWEELMRRGEAIYGRVDEFPEDVRDLMAIGGTKSIALVAIMVGTEPWGVLGLDECKSYREWLDVEIDTMKSLANILGAAIAKEEAEERLKKETEQSLKHLSVLLDLYKMDLSELDPAIRRILERDAWALSVERVGLWKFSEDRTELVCEDLFELSKGRHEKGMRLTVDRYPGYFRALEESLVVAADDAREDPRTKEFCEDYLVPFGITSMMDVPVRIHGKVWGVVCHEHVGPKRIWSLEEQEFAASISELIAVAIESHERKAAEERYREIFENAVEGIYQSIPEGRFIRANPAFAKMLGYESPEELISSITDIKAQLYVDPDRRDLFIRSMEEEGFVRDFEFRAYRKDGSIVWLSENARAVRDEGGRILYFEGMVEDVTERRRLWDQLLQAQKMEVIGRFAGEIVHDFNNLLTVIFTNIDLLLPNLDPSSPVYEKLLNIRKAAERSVDLSKRLLTFSRRQEAHPVNLNLNDLIRRMKEMIVGVIGEDIRCVFDLVEGLSLVRVDQGLMEQAIMNIIVNAREAMPRGGTLTIKTENVDLGEDYCRVHHGVAPGKYVCLSISDTGVGMSPEVMEHIFEPFFTTKPEGTGLGLSSVYGIVKQFGGHIFAYSEVGKGTTFKIYIPALEEEGEDHGRLEAEGKVEMPRGKETILLVEDRTDVLSLLSQLLEELGYTVIPASSVEEGISKAYEHEGPIDLLLTDVVLPDGSGPDLAFKLLERYKGMKLLFMSGYTDRHVFVNHIAGDLRKAYHFIPKPFSPSELARKIREVLEEG